MDNPGLGKLCVDDIDTERRYNIRFVSKMPSCVGLGSGVFEPLLTQLRNLPQHSSRPIVNIINHNLLSRLEPVHSVLCFGKPDKIQFTSVHCLLFRMLLPVLLITSSVVSARSMFEESSSPGEFLPEDTFRKLAAVLYRRGDKAENRLKRKYLFNSNVTCNDGSSAGYYIRRNSETRRWVIYLEGGWFCYDDISCEARWHRLRTLMSSDR